MSKISKERSKEICHLGTYTTKMGTDTSWCGDMDAPTNQGQVPCFAGGRWGLTVSDCQGHQFWRRKSGNMGGHEEGIRRELVFYFWSPKGHEGRSSWPVDVSGSHWLGRGEPERCRDWVGVTIIKERHQKVYQQPGSLCLYSTQAKTSRSSRKTTYSVRGSWVSQGKGNGAEEFHCFRMFWVGQGCSSWWASYCGYEVAFNMETWRVLRGRQEGQSTWYYFGLPRSRIWKQENIRPDTQPLR